MLEDARHHGIEILPLDIDRSEPEYTVEILGDGGRDERAARRGIRLGLKDVHGISDAEIDSILRARAERSFVDVGDVLRRTNLTRPVAEALAHAGAFDRLAGGAGTRRDRLYVAMTAEAPQEGEQATLPLLEHPAVAGLCEYSSAERVKAELEVIGMDATRHLMDFYRPLLEDLRVTPAARLGDLKGDRWLMVAGVKVASQTPAVRSGQRIIFLTLDDGTGLSDVTVFERVQPWCAKAIFHGFLLAVWGRLRRTGVRGASLVAKRVWDLTVLSTALHEGRLQEALADGGPGPAARTSIGAGAFVPPPHGMAAVPVPKVWHSSGGSAGR